MKLKATWRFFLLCGLAVTADATLGSVSASQIRYSWSGRLMKSSPDGEDPWQIGSEGVNFDLRIDVARTASDLDDIDVPSAAFDATTANLVLNGQEAQYIDNGVLVFRDNTLAGFDSFLFAGRFEHNGETIEIGSSLTLHTSTFAFTNAVEPPPFFATTSSILRTAFGPLGPYTGIVPAGASLFVVPEPFWSEVAGVALLMPLMFVRRPA